MLWYESTWMEILWIIPCILWLLLNCVVLKIVLKRLLDGSLTDPDIIRLSIPVAELTMFLTMVFLHVPVCAFKVTLIQHQVLICGYIVAGIKKLTRFAVTYTTVAIIIDLHAGITDPLAIHRPRLIHKFHVFKIITCIWLLSVILTVPRMSPYDKAIIASNLTSEAQRRQEIIHARSYHAFLFAFDFVVPFSIIGPLSYQMITSLRKSRFSQRNSQKSRYIIIGIVTLNFGVRLPYHLHRLISIVLAPKIDFDQIDRMGNLTTNIMYLMYPLNALLFWGLYPEFMDTLLQVLHSLFHSNLRVRSSRVEQETNVT